MLRQAFQSTRPVRGATPPIQLRQAQTCYFNPRAPCGARHAEILFVNEFGKFQSTRPVRGATVRLPSVQVDGRYFNPRAPCGARLTLSSTRTV